MPEFDAKLVDLIYVLNGFFSLILLSFPSRQWISFSLYQYIYDDIPEELQCNAFSSTVQSKMKIKICLKMEKFLSSLFSDETFIILIH